MKKLKFVFLSACIFTSLNILPGNETDILGPDLKSFLFSVVDCFGAFKDCAFFPFKKKWDEEKYEQAKEDSKKVEDFTTVRSNGENVINGAKDKIINYFYGDKWHEENCKSKWKVVKKKWKKLNENNV